MDIIIVPMSEGDRAAVMDMMRVFYASPAILSDGSDEVFGADIDACVGSSPYAEGYVFKLGDAAVGYAMLAKSFSTEYGKPCIWIEDIYVKPEYRGRGVGGRFLRSVGEIYPDALLRLEAESGNAAAIELYKKHGFTVLPYTELKK